MKAINLIAPFERLADRTLEGVPGKRLYPTLLGALILLGFLPHPRKERSRLDIQKGRGHLQKLARVLKIVHVRLCYVSQILVRYLGHEDVPDLDLCLAYQLQQQIERPVEVIQFYFIFTALFHIT